ncbi:MAG: HK97 family phage prohead protease [Methyloceanibacter sp.]|nr:HK97 family phage prohead protease [Methyloceanibacter sp.]
MKPQDILGLEYERVLTLDRQGINEERRTVPAALSSEIEVKRFFGSEVLVHTPEAVNLERAGDGLPMLFGHDQDQPIGLVEDVRVEDDKLRGTLRFSQNPRATEIWNDVRDGFLKNISIGYRINKFEEEDSSDLVRVTEWTPFEASVVTVPADHTVGVNRSTTLKEETAMSKETGESQIATRGQKSEGDAPVNVVEFNEVRDQALQEGEARAQEKLRKRIQEIDTLFAPFLSKGQKFRSLRDELVRRGQTAEQGREALLKLWAGDEPDPVDASYEQAEGSMNSREEQVQTTRTQQGRRVDRISGGEDAGEKMIRGMTQCLLIRSGLLKDEEAIAEARKSEWLSSSCVDLARHYLVSRGVSVSGMNRSAIIGAAITTRGLISHSSSDFADILQDAANKSLGIGYNEAPETWNLWCSTINIPDFKVMNVPNMSAFGDLDLVYEDGEYKYGTYSDKKETLQLATYGKLFSISRQALVNDDLNAFTRVPNGMGRAAARQVGDLAWGVLINNPNMNEDGVALFAAGHNNLAASGAAPSVDTIDAARTAMATQTDPSGSAVLNIPPSYLLVPRALEGKGMQIQNAEFDPAIGSGVAPNFLRGTFQTIAEARLDADNAAKWYMAASPSLIDTVTVGFLDGQQTPYLETQNGWSVDGVAYKVRMDAAAAPMDFRGLYSNPGA